MAKQPRETARDLPEARPAAPDGYRYVVVMLENGIHLTPPGEGQPRRFAKGEIVAVSEEHAAAFHKDGRVTAV